MTTTNTGLAATPAKLRSGAWGARVRSTDVSEGDVVTITTRAGKSWAARIVKVVWAGSGVTLCTTESLDLGRPSPRSRDRGKWTGCQCGSRETSAGDLIPSDRNCRQCDFDGFDN